MPTLVLSRKKDQVIRISDGIKITVVNIDKGQVKLAIEAPSHISVDREEIYLRKLNNV